MPEVKKISSSHLEQISKLRESVKDLITPYYDTDFNLLRWLQGHNYDFKEIVPKLRSHLIFRKSVFQLDKMAEKSRCHPVHEYWKAGLTGLAVRTPNTLVNIEQTGLNDYWGILHTFSVNDILKARIYDLELMLQSIMKLESETGEQASVLYIMDLHGLKYDKNLVTLLKGALSSISAFMTEHYVEMIKCFVLINAPSFISIIWGMAKPLLPERTRNKVKIFGGQNWEQEILKIACPEALPAFWNERNGNNSDVKFLANVEKATPVDPASYYIDRKPEEPGFELIKVNPGRYTFFNVTVVEGCSLSWKFETNGHFAYALYYAENCSEENTSNMEIAYPRFNKVPGPTFVPIFDKIICKKGGTYKFWFSNQHAWLHVLDVKIRLETNP